MRWFRLVLPLASCVLAVSLLFYLSVVDFSGPPVQRPDVAAQKSGLGSLFSFHGPLFPPSAIISLTDDNSTFFLARPAAFGPLLPSKGLSGELWIGSGFAHDIYGHDNFGSYTEGELGCSDVPGWDDEVQYLRRAGLRRRRSRPERTVHARTDRPEVELWGPRFLDKKEQMRRQKADIEGKVALLSRGGCGFLDKVKWAERRGATAVIVGDNVRGGPIITMYARGDTSNVTIPALFTSRTTAHLLSTLMPGGSFAFAATANKLRSSHQDSASADFYGLGSKKGPLKRMLRAARSMRKRWSRWILSRAVTDEEVRAEALASFDARTALPEVRMPKLHSRRTGSHFHVNRGRRGLWVTLTPTNMSSNPFLDTLLVLVVSPLVTLTVVYSLLLIRSRLQRRRWRAPKSVVERLPVRTYQTLPLTPSTTMTTPLSPSPTTPLLQSSDRSSTNAQELEAPSSPEGLDADLPTEREKERSGLAEWRRRFGGRQRECVVCLEEYEDGVSRVMSLPCGHEFHAECITPWLTTRRRTCPICKGDVVRSLARSQPPAESSSAFSRLIMSNRRRLSHQTSDDFPSATLLSEEEVQTEAAIRRNDSPSAALPVPQAVEMPADDGILDSDLESGPDVPRARQAEGNVWTRLGNLSFPWFSSSRRDDSDRSR